MVIKIQWVLCFFLFFSFIGCKSTQKSIQPPVSPQASSDNADSVTGAKNVIITNSSLKDMKAATLSCDNDSDCPKNIGLIMSAINNEVSHCTGFAVGNSTVMTNSHCLPDELNTGDSCKDKVFVSFASQNRVFDCQEVIFKSIKKDKHDLDYAFLSLSESIDGAPIKVDNSGVDENKNVKIFKTNADYIDGKIRGVLSFDECETFHITFPGLYHRRDSPGFASTCVVKPGNSGSPVLDKDGNAIGIIALGVRGKETDELVSRLKLADLKFESFSDFSIGSNFSCIKMPREVSAISREYVTEKPDCDMRFNEAKSKFLIEYFKEHLVKRIVSKFLKTNYANRYNHLPKEFLWQPYVIEKDDALKKYNKDIKASAPVLFAPKCIIHSGYQPDMLAVETEQPMLFFPVRLNRYLQWLVKDSASEIVQEKWVFKMAKNKPSESQKFTLTIHSPDGDFLGKKQIGYCN